jgi:hypothetical protein
MTLRDGTIVYDLNGMSAVPWEKVPARPAGRGPAAADAPKK